MRTAAADLTAVIAPPALFLLLDRAWPRFRHSVPATDPRLLPAVRGRRVPRGMFLVLYASGLLPGFSARSRAGRWGAADSR
jgi:hypothetical protein